MSVRTLIVEHLTAVGAAGATTAEIAAAIGSEHQTVSSAVHYLEVDRVLYASGRKHGRRSIWVLAAHVPLRHREPPIVADGRTLRRKPITGWLTRIEKLITGKGDFRDLYQTRLGLLDALLAHWYIEPLTLIGWLREKGWTVTPATNSRPCMDNIFDVLREALGEEEFLLRVQTTIERHPTRSRCA